MASLQKTWIPITREVYPSLSQLSTRVAFFMDTITRHCESVIFRTISIGIRFQSLLLQPVEKMSDSGSTVIKYDGKNVVISCHCVVFANENPKSGILHISMCILLDSDGGEAHVLPSVNRSVAASCCHFPDNRVWTNRKTNTRSFP